MVKCAGDHRHQVVLPRHLPQAAADVSQLAGFQQFVAAGSPG
jgi:hypothetical protein